MPLHLIEKVHGIIQGANQANVNNEGYVPIRFTSADRARVRTVERRVEAFRDSMRDFSRMEKRLGVDLSGIKEEIKGTLEMYTDVP